LSGNHDDAVVNRAEGFNALAEEAVDFTRNVLKPGSMAGPRKRARWAFLQECPTRVLDDDVLYVHGSPRDDRVEYILESDVLFGHAEKIESIFLMSPHLLFVGHTHVPGIIGRGAGFWHPEDNGAEYEIEPDKKLIINVGSVGQPRDGDNRACYVLTDGERVVYRRVSYDFRKTITKMGRVGPLSKQGGERIAYGR
jgi:diadenosine tetraphosphatase ApaH/serine/threonine PP2A family protein phosphatase